MIFMKTKTIVILGVFAVTLAVLAGRYPIGGIGIEFTSRGPGSINPSDNEPYNEPVRVTLVFPGSPAEVAGIKTNWFLISVDGTNVVSMSSTRCMSLVAGPIGTSVTLELADPMMSQTNEFIVKRVHEKLPNDILIHND